MNKIFLCLLLGGLTPLLSVAADVAKIDPKEAAQRVAAGQALLIDVREPAEWAETGVAAPAVLLAKSDFDGARETWKPFLKEHPPSKDLALVLYCRSGKRAAAVGAALADLGYTVTNAGGFKEWEAAGLPTRPAAGK